MLRSDVDTFTVRPTLDRIFENERAAGGEGLFLPHLDDGIQSQAECADARCCHRWFRDENREREMLTITLSGIVIIQPPCHHKSLALGKVVLLRVFVEALCQFSREPRPLAPGTRRFRDDEKTRRFSHPIGREASLRCD